MNKQESFLLLRKIKYGESDLILHALSPTGEKYSFIARGAMRSKKRFAGGVLEASHFVQLTFKESRQEGGLHTLLEASLINDFPGMRQSYDHLEFALRILECAYRVSQEGDMQSEGLYNLIGNTLKAIEKCEKLPVLKLQFYLKFLLQQGVLTLETWMKPFLRGKVQASEELSEYNELANDKISWIERRVEEYLQTAL